MIASIASTNTSFPLSLNETLNPSAEIFVSQDKPPIPDDVPVIVEAVASDTMEEWKQSTLFGTLETPSDAPSGWARNLVAAIEEKCSALLDYEARAYLDYSSGDPIKVVLLKILSALGTPSAKCHTKIHVKQYHTGKFAISVYSNSYPTFRMMSAKGYESEETILGADNAFEPAYTIDTEERMPLIAELMVKYSEHIQKTIAKKAKALEELKLRKAEWDTIQDTFLGDHSDYRHNFNFTLGGRTKVVISRDNGFRPTITISGGLKSNLTLIAETMKSLKAVKDIKDKIATLPIEAAADLDNEGK